MGFRGVMGANGQPPMGAVGMGVGQFGNIGQPPMGASGFPPMGAFGNSGQPPMGFRGAMGASGQPPMGASGFPPTGIGGFPPTGMIGFPPLGNMGQPPSGNQGSPPGGGLQPGDYVTAVVELKGTRQETVHGLKQPVLFLNHKWGKTAYHEDGEIQLFMVLSSDQKKKIPQAQWSKHAFLDTPAEQFKQRRATLAASKDSDLFMQYLDLAAWCLEVGFPTSAPSCSAKSRRWRRTARTGR